LERRGSQPGGPTAGGPDNLAVPLREGQRFVEAEAPRDLVRVHQSVLRPAHEPRILEYCVVNCVVHFAVNYVVNFIASNFLSSNPFSIRSGWRIVTWPLHPLFVACLCWREGERVDQSVPRPAPEQWTSNQQSVPRNLLGASAESTSQKCAAVPRRARI